jgi:effector-binding domain-containing protein
VVTEPKVEERKAQPYVAVRSQIMMSEVYTLSAQFGEVFGWLASKGIQPVGAPFYRYRTIDLVSKMEMDVGVPVATSVTTDGRIVADILPAGRYATIVYTGPYDGVGASHQVLFNWATKNGIAWDMSKTGTSGRWGAFLEIYPTDPTKEPNPAKWQTELAFKLADR